MYHEVKLEQGKFNWCDQRLKNKKQKQLIYLHVKTEQENTHDDFIRGRNN